MNNAQMKQIDVMMNQSNAGQFASIKTRTRVGILKANGSIVTSVRALKEGESLVEKESELVTQIKTDYLNRVIKKNPEFELSPRKWGERISKNLVEHKENLYLETIFNPDAKMPKPKVKYFVNGIETDKGELNIPERAPSKSGIEVRVFKAESILEITVNKEKLAA